MSRHVAIAEVEPVVGCHRVLGSNPYIPCMRLHRDPGFVAQPPASLGVNRIGQRVDHRVDVGRDVQPVHHGVITRVDECGHCVVGIREAHSA